MGALRDRIGVGTLRSSSVDPYRRLAAAVVLRAVQDVLGRGLSNLGNGHERREDRERITARAQERARRWIDSPGLDLWAELAGLEAEEIREQVRAKEEGSG